jgi:hypothetical protein
MELRSLPRVSDRYTWLLNRFMNPGRLTMPNCEQVLGRAVIELWADLPQPVQERIFECVPDDPGVRHAVAQLLHDLHPKTAHPPRPTALA